MEAEKLENREENYQGNKTYRSNLKLLVQIKVYLKKYVMDDTLVPDRTIYLSNIYHWFLYFIPF